MEITRDTTFGEMLAYDPNLGQILMSVGMHCAFCPAHAVESLEQGCLVHGLDVDRVLQVIEEYEASKTQA